jgi:hypothetical protein
MDGEFFYSWQGVSLKRYFLLQTADQAGSAKRRSEES